MKLGDLKKLLEEHGLRPLHGRSQNFLLNDSVVSKMVEAAGVGEGSRVLEIGPGPGILTEVLLSAGAEVVAVEIDPGLCKLLKSRFGDNDNFKLIEGDLLEIENQELVKHFGNDSITEWKVVANLPYAITSAVLEKFLFHVPHPTSMTMMLQREVVDRILAKPKKMNSLAVACQSLGVPEKVVDVPRGSFFPAPKVDSAVIHIRLKNVTEKKNFFHSVSEENFFKTVRQAFSQKRKQLRNSLKGLSWMRDLPELHLKQAKILPSARPEELTPEDWIRLLENAKK